MTEFEGNKLQNVAKGDLKLGEDTDLQRKKDKQMKKDFEPLLKWWKTILGNKVEKVALSKRLTDSCCTVVGSQ